MLKKTQKALKNVKGKRNLTSKFSLLYIIIIINYIFRSKTIKRKSTNNLLSTPTKHQHTAEFMTSYSPNNSSDESGNNDISIAVTFT